MTMSESRGIDSHICAASSAPYPNAHMPFAGESGDPNILNVVRGPAGDCRSMTADPCFSHKIEGEFSRSS
jgi:hypothetical protein